MQSLTRPNGSTTSYQYNGVNQLTEILNKTSTNDVLNQHVFTYNTLDLRGSETISGSALPATPALPTETVDYAYNTVNQLLSVTNPNLTFVYDDDGNMIQGYTPDGYVFTAEYDAKDQMTWLEYTDSSSVEHRTEYSYSGDEFLAIIRKFENSSLVDEIRIVRDGFLAVQERDGSNTVLREYTWGLNLGGGIGGLLNLKQGGQDYSYLYDGKGNVTAVLDSAQSVVAAYRYAPFGKLLAKTGSLTQPFGFSTKRYDAQTGLIHYQYRPYAPSIGRWLTRDPLGEEGGMNLYAFVGNNPVSWVDPWGLWGIGGSYGGTVNFFGFRVAVQLEGRLVFSKDYWDWNGTMTTTAENCWDGDCWVAGTEADYGVDVLLTTATHMDQLVGWSKTIIGGAAGLGQYGGDFELSEMTADEHGNQPLQEEGLLFGKTPVELSVSVPQPWIPAVNWGAEAHADTMNYTRSGKKWVKRLMK